jgi:hypothetical protein
MTSCYVITWALNLANRCLQHIYCHGNSNKYVPKLHCYFNCSHSNIQTDSGRQKFMGTIYIVSICVQWLCVGCYGTVFPDDRCVMTRCVGRQHMKNPRLLWGKAEFWYRTTLEKVQRIPATYWNPSTLTHHQFQQDVFRDHRDKHKKQTQMKHVEILKFHHVLKKKKIWRQPGVPEIYKLRDFMIRSIWILGV